MIGGTSPSPPPGRPLVPLSARFRALGWARLYGQVMFGFGLPEMLVVLVLVALAVWLLSRRKRT